MVDTMTSLPQACLTTQWCYTGEQRPQSENKKISGSCLPYSDRRYIIDASTGSVFWMGKRNILHSLGVCVCMLCVVVHCVRLFAHGEPLWSTRVVKNEKIEVISVDAVCLRISSRLQLLVNQYPTPTTGCASFVLAPYVCLYIGCSCSAITSNGGWRGALVRMKRLPRCVHQS